jgi:hypothetical protein
LPVGDYLIRVRKLGYAPTTLTLKLVDQDDREVVIRLRALPVNLDAMVIAERSGYAPDDHALEDLDKRMRWQNFRTIVAGRDRLAEFGTMGLDQVLAGLGATGAEAAAKQMAQARQLGRGRIRESGFGDDCILLNGKTQLHQPLRSFKADQIEMVEVYPPGSEVTGTISDKMRTNECRALSLFQHPTYYVVWLRGDR